MPFPGSQQRETIGIAYFLNGHMLLLRLIGGVLLLGSLVVLFKQLSWGWKIFLSAGLAAYATVFYMFNFRFLADKMFLQPKQLIFSNLIDNKVNQSSLVLGVQLNGETKAYPIEIIGYHHQVRDSIGGLPVMITYCTVCRTGRVFSPVVDGTPEDFRLVGMDHFNAMFEDATTKSWWRQATGVAVAGPLTGKVLTEYQSQQMTLQAWLALYPASKIMQPDSTFTDKYKKLEGFDRGTIASHLEYRDSLSWKDKSWVLGVKINNMARAYDWNDLIQVSTINDTLNSVPILIHLQPDSSSFHVWKRDSLLFYTEAGSALIKDKQTNSEWNTNGECISGTLKGLRLEPLQAYQEFWHSWRTFNKNSSRYLIKDLSN